MKYFYKYYFLKRMKAVGCSNNVRPKKCDVINAKCVSKTFQSLAHCNGVAFTSDI